MTIPYIDLRGPDVCYGRDGDPRHVATGFHAFFYAYIPFVPTFLSDDFTRMITGEASRIKLIVTRQIRFLNDLASCKTGAGETLDLRFVSVPQPGQPYNKVWLFFVGKAFDEDRTHAHDNAVNLWRRFNSHFPLEDPFNYPLRVIEAADDGTLEPDDKEALGLARLPITRDRLKPDSLIEIRKFEDNDPMLTSADEGQPSSSVGYYPHPFRPTIDFSAMSRFLETFARQPQRCVASICLRPTTLSLEEQREINRMMGQYAHLADGARSMQNWLALYRAERFEDLRRTFDPIINQRNHLFLIKIQVVGENYAPREVVAALGSEIMNNSTPEPRRWTELVAETDAELAVAFKNFEFAEYRPWQRQDPKSALWRLSSLVTSYEAVGAFRLPVPPESGHMPGISVRDEPFVMPTELATPQNSPIRDDPSIPLGKVLHRGTKTATYFPITLSQLRRHALVTGSTGSGKSNTCLHILTQLWRSNQIGGFLVIYPIDKPDYRLLMADPDVRDQLLLFTLGDDTTSPFRFNPFAVPDGILVRTHISLLMRAFTAAFSMWDPLPAVYRAALRYTYEEAGYHDLRTAKGGDPGTTAPLLSRFYELLVETAEAMTQEYGRDAKGNIRQGSEIRIRDLLLNAGHIINVREAAPWDVLLAHPTVMEIGRVGSVEDGALMMGFLLMSLTSYLASRLKREGKKAKQHVTLIEEAHRLMAAGSHGGGDGAADPRGKASEDFANILSEVRGFGESIIIAEQTPTELVTGAIANTYVKVMHWLEEQRSFELFAEVMNLNKQQREYARTLPQGQAIVRGASGRPTLVQVTNYLDRFQNPDDSARLDDSDEAVHLFMGKQTARLGFVIPDPVPFAFSAPSAGAPAASTRDAAWPIMMPMQTCALCHPLLASAKCPWGQIVRGKTVFADEDFRTRCDADYAACLMAASDRAVEDPLAALTVRFTRRFAGVSAGAGEEMLYCYLAHRAQETLRSALDDPTTENAARRDRARQLLRGVAARQGPDQAK